MEIKEIRIKSASELSHLLAEAKKKVDDLKFKAAQKQLKNVRELREAKNDLARILTILKEKNQ